MLCDRVLKACLEACQLTPDRVLVVGVSGGPDSLCLLDCLAKASFNLLVAHFDHRLRPESGEDARRVAAMAAQRGLPFESGCMDVAAFAQEQRLSIEEAARNARYTFLFDVARRSGAQAVAVAHNADDQVETVLMHLLRGAGLAGLRGMSARSLQEGWDERIPLVRPLLGIWRAEIEGYCQEMGLDVVRDASNDDTSFYRNRLRHELLPTLTQYNPQVKEALWRTAQVLSGDTEIYESAVERAWEQVALESTPESIAFDRKNLLTLSLGLQRALLRRAIARLRPGLRDVDFETVERGLVFAARPARSRSIELAQGLRLIVEGERLYLAERDAAVGKGDWPQLVGGVQLELNVPGELDLGEGWRLQAEWALPGADVRAAGRWEAWLDADCLHVPLIVRVAQPGERFQPLGLGGRSQKLSDFWINVRLAKRARSAWPLVCSGDAIAWIPGYRLDQRFRVTHSTQKLVHLQMLS